MDEFTRLYLEDISDDDDTDYKIQPPILVPPEVYEQQQQRVSWGEPINPVEFGRLFPDAHYIAFLYNVRDYYLRTHTFSSPQGLNPIYNFLVKSKRMDYDIILILRAKKAKEILSFYKYQFINKGSPRKPLRYELRITLAHNTIALISREELLDITSGELPHCLLNRFYKYPCKDIIDLICMEPDKKTYLVNSSNDGVY